MGIETALKNQNLIFNGTVFPVITAKCSLFSQIA